MVAFNAEATGQGKYSPIKQWGQLGTADFQLTYRFPDAQKPSYAQSGPKGGNSLAIIGQMDRYRHAMETSNNRTQSDRDHKMPVIPQEQNVPQLENLVRLSIRKDGFLNPWYTGIGHEPRDSLRAGKNDKGEMKKAYSYTPYLERYKPASARKEDYRIKNIQSKLYQARERSGKDTKLPVEYRPNIKRVSTQVDLYRNVRAVVYSLRQFPRYLGNAPQKTSYDGRGTILRGVFSQPRANQRRQAA